MVRLVIFLTPFEVAQINRFADAAQDSILRYKPKGGFSQYLIRVIRGLSPDELHENNEMMRVPVDPRDGTGRQSVRQT
jgi:hypothetical protein